MVRERRTELGLTQEELARRAGMSVRALRYLEQGRVRNPRTASIRQLVAALETAVDVAVTPAALRIGVLGPLSVEVGGQPVDLGRTRHASLLGLLALHPNRPVALADIADMVWTHRPPRSYANLVNIYVRRLRKQLGPALRLVAVGHGGYQLEVEPAELDLMEFVELTAEARAARDTADAHDLYARALACWRGHVLTDLDPLQRHPATGPLARQRLSATLAYADIGIALGEHEQAAAQLRSVRDDEPLHEGLHARLMVALAGSGQQAAALELFDDLRGRLSAELGIEPGPELRSAQLQVLRQEIPASACVPFGGSNFLPRDVDDFVGRAAEIERLAATLSTNRAAVHAISGMAGVGKTALAIHLGHRLADRYPDGQLFVDLHAHSSARGPLTPRAALDALLRQLGVDSARIPDQLDQCAALWRSMLVGRNILVVLDDAADAAQVRPLLPGGGTNCLVLITSRQRLTSVDAVRPLSLDVLADDEAATLFTRVAGPERTAGQDAQAREVLRLCGFLPLAIRIAAARLRDRPQWTITHLVSLLADEHRRLPELSTGDRSVGAAFTLSYHQLSAPLQQIFRLLGDFPGVDLDAYVAAALADVEPAEASTLLERLVDVHLLQQPALGRYRLHDLIRDHARVTTCAVDPLPEREAAVTRVVDYYLHVAAKAADVLEPSRRRFPLAGSSPAHMPNWSGDARAALEWFEAERANLTAAAVTADERGLPERCWRLIQTRWRFFFIRGHVHDWIDTHRLALAVTRRIGDAFAEAEIRKNLGLGLWRCGHFEEALTHHVHALELDVSSGDRWGEAKTRNHLGLIHGRAGRYDEAVDQQRRSAALYHEVGDECGEARALIGLGDVHHHAGRHSEGVATFRRALALARKSGDRWGEGIALIGLGFAAPHIETPAAALEYLDTALAFTRASGDRWSESIALIGSATAHQMMDAPEEAMNRYRQAIILAHEVGDRWWERLALTGLGRLCADLGQYAEAVRHHEHALALARVLDDAAVEAETLADLEKAGQHLAE